MSETSEPPVRKVIFDTDMGSYDAWVSTVIIHNKCIKHKFNHKTHRFILANFIKALQMLVSAEQNLKTVKIAAITCVDGNEPLAKTVRNVYRILHQLDRKDVSF